MDIPEDIWVYLATRFLPKRAMFNLSSANKFLRSYLVSYLFQERTFRNPYNEGAYDKDDKIQFLASNPKILSHIRHITFINWGARVPRCVPATILATLMHFINILLHADIFMWRIKRKNTLPPLLDDLPDINLISFISSSAIQTASLTLVPSKYPHPHPHFDSTSFVQYAYEKNNLNVPGFVDYNADNEDISLRPVSVYLSGSTLEYVKSLDGAKLLPLSKFAHLSRLDIVIEGNQLAREE
ncbi:hypothetical protein M422DRAFT_266706 [Sphaerobolus stellatus SS14]|uniref:Uncharacterized protein n=1 Tax=Sphaerobolus stellatus (strain SS14) TaxID=990650 RepID=A0A0C9UR02_SPHS4|nr:hypothetical protein M422DRAFT_266706 [Sphaerobolus stellatus SS14]